MVGNMALAYPTPGTATKPRPFVRPLSRPTERSATAPKRGDCQHARNLRARQRRFEHCELRTRQRSPRSGHGARRFEPTTLANSVQAARCSLVRGGRARQPRPTVHPAAGPDDAPHALSESVECPRRMQAWHAVAAVLCLTVEGEVLGGDVDRPAPCSRRRRRRR